MIYAKGHATTRNVKTPAADTQAVLHRRRRRAGTCAIAIVVEKRSSDNAGAHANGRGVGEGAAPTTSSRRARRP